VTSGERSHERFLAASCVGALVCGIVLILAGCGAAGKGHSSTARSKSSTTQKTESSPTTTTTATQALKTIRCPRKVSLPARGKYAGQTATVFIVNAGPKKSGCGFASGWMAEWIKAGASPGGYAIGRLGGIRCDEPVLANSGPLGKGYARYRGVIHCDQIANDAVDPQAELDSDSAGILGYYGHGIITGSHRASGPAGGPAIPGSTLSKAVAKELGRDGVQPDSVTCPALARERGATATCKISGKDPEVGSGQARGTAQVTIQDRAGHRAVDSFQLNGAHGKEVRGTGYPFDPETGRVL